MKEKAKPVRSSSHRKEDHSKRYFEELIDPFFVPGWHTKDYGIDAIVDITTLNESLGDVELESKCFLAQLKSSEKLIRSKTAIKFSVPVKKVLYWYNYNLPVLFSLFDVTKKVFNYIWINEELIASLDALNPNWSSQKTVTINLPSKSILKKSSLQAISDYVHRWKMPPRKELKPGKYFELKNKAHLNLAEYKNIAPSLEFRSINETISKLEIDIDQSLYRVAITGPSRVGKSSLVNALLNKNVSPTGFYQTTGVPIQIIPGVENKVSIYFNDGKQITRPFAEKTITDYASQNFNEDNKKQVKLVSISIKNQQLERGVSLFDIPGLDDPSDEILEYTWQTVRKVNAIIYVIDATPAETGGYIFRNEYKKHITTFSQSQDKVFLVFNKADRLSDTILTSLKQRVQQDLQKYQLAEIINDRCYFLSAEGKQGTSQCDNIDRLNNDLWAFILTENKFGIVKLNLLNQELFKSTKTFTEILQTRLIDSETKIRLEEEIALIRSKIPLLKKSIYDLQKGSKKMLFSSIDNRQNHIISKLEDELNKIPVLEDLPSSAAIRKYLIDNLNNTLEQSNNEYVEQVNQVKGFIDQWISDNLKQLREILNRRGETKFIDFTEVDTFESPQIDFSSAWGMGIIALTAAYFFAPAYILISGVIGFFGNLFASAESRRAKQISKILQLAKNRYQTSFNKLKNGYTELLKDQSEAIDNYVLNSLSHYFRDIEDQLNKLNRPGNKSEIAIFKQTLKKIEMFQSMLTDFDAELRSYYFTK
jgi:GTPase Era involved in 16S rRNA processing